MVPVLLQTQDWGWEDGHMETKRSKVLPEETSKGLVTVAIAVKLSYFVRDTCRLQWWWKTNFWNNVSLISHRIYQKQAFHLWLAAVHFSSWNDNCRLWSLAAWSLKTPVCGYKTETNNFSLCTWIRIVFYCRILHAIQCDKGKNVRSQHYIVLT